MAWTLFVFYLVFTTYLGYLGSKQTKDFNTFAIGDGHMSPIVVGVTLAASTASAATFIVNPGFVYVHGLAAFMHLGIAVFIGILFMLLLASYRFRIIGSKINAVTIPHWLGLRYSSRKFAIYFSIINLLSFAFLVLLVGGISIVMQKLLDINNITALLITLIFVTGYVIKGGTYAHVFTNMLQGSLMIIISLIVVGNGTYMMFQTESFWQEVSAINPVLTQWTNSDSNLYNDWFSVYLSGFLIGVALVCQPHILTKALYVDSDKNVSKYIAVFSVVYLLFSCLLLAGFWALVVVPPDMLVDASTGQFRQDLVMTSYLQEVFPDWLFTIISVVLLAAAMSTLDGLMVGLSTITANDFWINVTSRSNGTEKSTQDYRRAYKVSHIVLIILAILTFFVTLNPPKLLGIFGQFGVYALVLTSLPPIINGVFFNKPSLPVVWIASVAAITIYILLYWQGSSLFDTNLAFANPAVPAAIAILLTTIPALIIQFYINKKKINA